MKEYTQVQGLSGVYVVHKGNLRSTALRLADNSLCIVSPLAGLPLGVYEAIAEHGKVAHVLAPNHYHHKGLSEACEAFPKAKLYAPAAATDRLQKQSGLRFSKLQTLAKRLPKHASFVETQGLKTGEVWVRLLTPTLAAWVVVDAFCGPKLAATGAAAPDAKKPELLKPFPTFGVGDKAIYSAWATQQIKADQPKLLIPCHGRIVRSATLPAALTSLTKGLAK